MVWEKRHYLSEKPEALSRVLQAAHSWDWASLSELYTIVKDWSPITPLQALELLLPRYLGNLVRWGQPSVYFPIGDHVNVSWCRSQSTALRLIATSHNCCKSHHKTTPKFSSNPTILFSRKSTRKYPPVKSDRNKAIYVGILPQTKCPYVVKQTLIS